MDPNVDARQGMFCDRCGASAIERITLEGRQGTFICARCGRTDTRQVRPLLIVTGASGVGKTSIIPHLQRELTEMVVLDKDAMWARDWDMAYNNLFRVASAVAQSGRPTMVVGTILPDMIDGLSDRCLVDPVVYANLHCSDASRRTRLLGRRTWDIPDDAFIRQHAEFAGWLLKNADTAFDPPMPTFDTDADIPAQVAGRVAMWARTVMSQGDIPA
jgi:hypothetical protein